LFSFAFFAITALELSTLYEYNHQNNNDLG